MACVPPGHFPPLVCVLCSSTAVAARCWELEAGSFKCNYGGVNHVSPEGLKDSAVGRLDARYKKCHFC